MNEITDGQINISKKNVERKFFKLNTNQIKINPSNKNLNKNKSNSPRREQKRDEERI
jgi:hypothetical protein